MLTPKKLHILGLYTLIFFRDTLTKGLSCTCSNCFVFFSLKLIFHYNASHWINSIWQRVMDYVMDPTSQAS